MTRKIFILLFIFATIPVTVVNAQRFSFKHRAGADINYGFGLSSHTWFVTDKGNDVALSTGGGYAFGVQYGLEMNKMYDLSVDILYQFSTLSSNASNVKGSFDRVVFSLTPSYILPLKLNKMQVKAGLGLDFYFSCVMNIDATKIDNGEKLKLNYKAAFGPHISAVYEYNFFKNHFATGGLKFYYVNYKFNPSGSTHDYSVDPKLSEQNGSGIDIMLGYSYHF